MAVKDVLIFGSGSAAKRYYNLVRKNHPNLSIDVVSRTDRVLTWAGDNIAVKDRIAIEATSYNCAIVCSSPKNHYGDLMLALKLTDNVLIEKPLCAEIEEAVFVEQFLKHQPNKNVFVGYNLRMDDCFLRLELAIRRREFGKIIMAKLGVGQNLSMWRPERDYRLSVSASRTEGGGVLLELSHEIDAMLQLFGHCRFQSGALFCSDILELEVEDVVTASFIGRVYEQFFPIQIAMDFVRSDSYRVYEVACQYGTLQWNAIEGTLSILKAGSQTIICQSDVKDTYSKLLSFLVNREGHERLASVESSVDVLRVVEQIKSSGEWFGDKLV